ncbi:MAG: hypothetical protein K1X64_05030 [Myxococcaceae bacterium]|nr:hypothetical protein [Myxococcaceae bacterium]
MKSLLLSFCAVALFACGTISAPTDAELENDTASNESALATHRANVWFPMQENNTWTLQAPWGETRTITLRDVNNGVGYLTGLDRWVGIFSSAPNSLYLLDENTDTWNAFIRFGYAVTPWTWGQGACNAYTVRRAPNAGPVVTPAGTFSDTRTIEFERLPSPTARCLPPLFTALTFAPHVGLVAIDNDDGRFLLTSATVNGKSYPVSTGIKATLRLDKTIYFNQPNTIRCVTTPCPTNEVTAVAKATYTVTNQGPGSQTFHFNTGCQFDVAIFDTTGNTVKSLSQLRFCTQALTAFTLAKGQSKTFTDTLSLDGPEGQLFGNFTATAKLLARNNADWADATTRFTVSEP